MSGSLLFHHGTMGDGKTAMALQHAYTLRRGGRSVVLATFGDRSETGQLTSRIGISADGLHVSPGNGRQLISTCAVVGATELLVDEAQFATPDDVGVFLEIVAAGTTVEAFGLLTDFRGILFPGSQRLIEVGAELHRLPLRSLCWCGEQGVFNGRVQDGVLVREGPVVVIGDTDSNAEEPSYQVLCRTHYATGQVGS
jgi:thymidine kinase